MNFNELSISRFLETHSSHAQVSASSISQFTIVQNNSTSFIRTKSLTCTLLHPTMETKEIKDIKAYIAELVVVATVKQKSAVGTFANGQYINIELYDGDTIKLTLFGENVTKGELLTVSDTFFMYIYKGIVNFDCFTKKN